MTTGHESLFLSIGKRIVFLTKGGNFAFHVLQCICVFPYDHLMNQLINDNLVLSPSMSLLIFTLFDRLCRNSFSMLFRLFVSILAEIT